MATQIQPETNNSQQNSEQTTQPNTETETPPTQNQPASNTQATPTSVQDLNLLAFRTAERERQRLEEENRQLLQRLQSEKKPQDYSSLNDRFLTEPAAATAEITRNIVQEEIRNAFAPLANDFKAMQRTTAYTALKAQVRQVVPNFDRIESAVDAIMANQEPTVANMQVAIPLAIGQLAMNGQWNGGQTAANNNPAPSNNANANNNPIPAQLSPTPPAPPRPVTPAQSRPLSELEKRVARENGMSEEEYIKFRDMDEKAVATSQVGIQQSK